MLFVYCGSNIFRLPSPKPFNVVISVADPDPARSRLGSELFYKVPDLTKIKLKGAKCSYTFDFLCDQKFGIKISDLDPVPELNQYMHVKKEIKKVSDPPHWLYVVQLEYTPD